MTCLSTNLTLLIMPVFFQGKCLIKLVSIMCLQFKMSILSNMFTSVQWQEYSSGRQRTGSGCQHTLRSYSMAGDWGKLIFLTFFYSGNCNDPLAQQEVMLRKRSSCAHYFLFNELPLSPWQITPCPFGKVRFVISVSLHAQMLWAFHWTLVNACWAYSSAWHVYLQ